MNAINTFLLAIVLALSLPASGQITYFVNATVTGGSQDGSSWDNAFANLHTALNAASVGDEIWVAEGTYLPSNGTDRLASFLLKNGVRLYGGFDGTETALGQRNWLVNETVLSGDIGIPGDSLDNSFTILRMAQVDTNTVVDGLYFRHGTANGGLGGNADFSKNGGAIYIGGLGVSSAYPRIRNCVFENNTANRDGGAVYVGGTFNGSFAPQFSNCTFTGNYAGRNGAGVSRNGGSNLEVRPDFLDCTFQQNFANGDGGGVFYSENEKTDTLEFTGCRFLNNTATNQGGGISIWGGRTDGSKTAVKNCEFTSNWAVEAEGNDFHYVATNLLDIGFIDIDSCTFRGSPFGSIQAIHVDAIDFIPDISTIKITNCQFLDNEATLVFITSNEFDSVIFMGNRIEGNGFDGPGVILSDANVVRMTHNSFVKNYPLTGPLTAGARLFSFPLVGDVTCANNVFFDNLLNYDGLLQGTGIDTLANCLIWNRLDTSSTDFFLGGFLDTFNVYLVNCVVLVDSLYGSFETLGATQVFLENTALSWDGCPVLPPSTGTSDPDPPYLFCDSNSLFDPQPLLADTAAGDYRLDPCSPARNAGNNDFAALFGLLTDSDRNPRISEGNIDLGPFEMLPFGLHLDNLTDTSCDGDTTGTLLVNVQSACAPFLLQLGDTSFLTDVSPILFSGLSAGQHYLSVTDAQGRTDATSVGIQLPIPLTITALPGEVDCETGKLANVTAVYTGGSGKVGYTWSTGTSGAWIINQPAGSYTITVTDVLGCTAVDSFEIVAIGGLDIMAEGFDVTCSGAADGVAWALPFNGFAPFAWLWENGTNDLEITGLPGGSYSVTVTDAIGCTGEAGIDVAEPDPIEVAAIVTPSTSSTDPNGAIEIVAIGGGTPGYTYFWSNGEAGPVIGNLPAGDYSLTVTDAVGCQQVFAFEVGMQLEPPGWQASLTPNLVAGGGQVWLQVEQGHEQRQMLDVKLLDALGRVVFSEKRAMAGVQRPFDMPQAAGTYFMLVENGGGERAVLRVVVQ